MMARFFYITCIFILIQNNVFGQVAHGTITATITTPVGAEISGDVSFEKFALKMKSITKNRNVANPENNETISPVKVIGETFAYNVTIEKDVLLKRKKDSKERYQSPEKYEPSLSITVNFD